jgi:hypothetical protein
LRERVGALEALIAYPQNSGREEREAKARLASVIFNDDVPDSRDTLLLGLADSTGVLKAILSPEDMRRASNRIAILYFVAVMVENLEPDGGCSGVIFLGLRSNHDGSAPPWSALGRCQQPLSSLGGVAPGVDLGSGLVMAVGLSQAWSEQEFGRPWGGILALALGAARAIRRDREIVAEHTLKKWLVIEGLRSDP